MASQTEIIGPTSSYYVSQRLRLHFVDWGNEDKPLLLLIHGGRDHARSWDWVARELRDDYHVIAPDLRGHGDSAWSPGGSYTLPEFVFDIVQLLDAVDAPGEDREDDDPAESVGDKECCNSWGCGL